VSGVRGDVGEGGSTDGRTDGSMGAAMGMGRGEVEDEGKGKGLPLSIHSHSREGGSVEGGVRERYLTNLCYFPVYN
jgi:hypothetical protein